MAKELPYFKFEPNQWDNGNIQICSRELKGLFIDLCSVYWSRLGELPYALALQKHCNGNKAALQELQEHQIIGVSEGQIIIEFLDEQLNEFQETSEKRRIAANKRWSNASALQGKISSNAIREEKRREEEIREEDKKTLKVFNAEVSAVYDATVSLFPENTRPKNDQQVSNWKDEIRKLIDVDGYDTATIEHVTRMAREDDFWSGNFLSISKLRKKNKEQIPYILVFIEKFKQQMKKAEGHFEKHQRAYLESVEQNGGIHPTDVDEHGQAY